MPPPAAPTHSPPPPPPPLAAPLRLPPRLPTAPPARIRWSRGPALLGALVGGFFIATVLFGKVEHGGPPLAIKKGGVAPTATAVPPAPAAAEARPAA